MDYEKAYKEALKRAKGFKTDEYKDVAEYIFPELEESESERIRKAIISFLKSPFVNESITDEKVTPWITWLEKQSKDSPVLSNSSNIGKDEQKPAEWSSEQSKTLQTDDVPNESSTAAPLRTGAIGFDGEPMESKPCEHNSVWSKEDEKIIINIGEYLNCYGNYIVDKNEEKAAKIYKSADWLKSLKERYTWKPSDEQMEALWNVYQGGKEQAELAILYNDLKKLKK